MVAHMFMIYVHVFLLLIDMKFNMKTLDESIFLMPLKNQKFENVKTLLAVINSNFPYFFLIFTKLKLKKLVLICTFLRLRFLKFLAGSPQLHFYIFF